MIYVYAIAPPHEAANGELRGIDEESVQLQLCGELAGWFSHHTDLPVAAQVRDAVRHEQVVEAIMQQTPVLPMRLWTTLPDQQELMRLLDRHAQQFAAGLEKVAGCVELGVRILGTESQAQRAPIDDSSGHAYMAARAAEERARAEAQQRTVALAQGVHTPLALLARDSCPGTSEINGTWSAAYLVETRNVAPFRRRVTELAQAQPALRILCTGPWPPYHFVPRLFVPRPEVACA